MSKYRVSADIGGTFTDIVVADESSGRTITGKVLSTPGNPADAVVAGLQRFVDAPSDIEFVVHGTTVGLNAFLERKGARVLLIMTRGVGDGYTIARGDRKTLYELRYHKPRRLVPRRDVHEVTERLRSDGSVLQELEESDFLPIIEKIRNEKITSVAVCFLHAYVNPAHELRAREILQAALPDVSVTLSHELAREWREYERASTAVMNAYIAPVNQRYLTSLERRLAELGTTRPLHVMQSSGGVIQSQTAREQPIHTLLSGPVGGTVGGSALARATGRNNLLCVDMGGTSFDMSLIVDGRPSVSNETEQEGLPLLLPFVEIHTIGAGGGSLAWLEAGALRVGPQSAGAEPGPACYGLGGTEPTVTDANLFLGRLGPESRLGGWMGLDADAARRAIGNLARILGIGDVALAEGMLAIINAKMADAIRTITIQRGIDPREFALVAYGGAGSMHAVWIARELGIQEIIVPWSPGTFSAWGMLQTDIRRDLTANFFHPLATVGPAELEAAFDQLETEGRGLLAEEAVPAADVYVERSADMRYVGQEYYVKVPVEEPIDLAALDARFHETHRTRYGHATPEAPVEFVNLRLAAFGQLRHSVQDYRASQDGTSPRMGERKVVFDSHEHDTPVLWRDRMQPGDSFEGPVVIEEESATTVVPPAYSATVDDLGNLMIRKG